MSTRNAIALNAAAVASSATAAGVALALAADGGAPEWVQLMPAGPTLQGRDGRRWTMTDPAAVAACSRTPIAFDYEHAQHIKAPLGEAAPAAGWIEKLEVREGAIWGRVEWTDRAKTAIAGREYRFVSPAFNYTPDSRDVVELLSAALVNRPNFDMTALNRADAKPETETPMKELLKALGLAETATEAEALTALNAQRTATLHAGEAISLDRFVPRADYDVALNRATAAEGKLTERDKADHTAKVAAAIEGAVKAGKIAPASKDYYVATRRTAEGLVEFEKFVAAAPSVFQISDVETRQGAVKTALNAEQKAAAKAMGVDEKKFAEFVATAA